VVMVVALLLRAPQHADVVTPSSARVPQSKYDYAPADVLKSLPFWLMYAMFVMVGTSGLMVTAQLAPVAADFAIDNVPVSILGLTMPALSFALSVACSTDCRGRSSDGCPTRSAESTRCSSPSCWRASASTR
jgi:MFS transporter, OFA family, oxalate/formate antiporter